MSPFVLYPPSSDFPFFVTLLAKKAFRERGEEEWRVGSSLVLQLFSFFFCHSPLGNKESSPPLPFYRCLNCHLFPLFSFAVALTHPLHNKCSNFETSPVRAFSAKSDCFKRSPVLQYVNTCYALLGIFRYLNRRWNFQPNLPGVLFI